ncbi:MAG: tRNA uridine-5-carboxymethylaminomethyl(34) synthesis GTPase MnmE [Clostridia bacterium]|nr:tRNA uridine-5-carboxymethylaminomethyl(34) synthesis GTPase MnmE [Clostridia bacterium]
MKDSTICAIATPLGAGGVSIIRISGSESLNIAFNFFHGKVKKENIEPRKLYLGTFESEEISDQVLLVYFKAPFSYTGEDVVEFQFHGGIKIAEKILKAVLEKCSLAEPGEFTKRAFLNGKISLDEAEGIADLIAAESEAELKSARSLQSGKLFEKTTEVQNKIMDLIAEIEANLDYPDDFEEGFLIDKSKELLDEIKFQIGEILENSKNGKEIKSGVNTAIVGKTNVGKSSLLNALLGENRAIVTNIEGTTRDVIKERIEINGIKFNLIDTAGLRESQDEVEKIGIEKTNEELENADLILFVLDLSRKITNEENKLLEKIQSRPHIVIGNKTDLEIKNDINCFKISAKNNENIEKLKQKMFESVISGKIDFSKIVLTNERHIQILKNILNKIKNFNINSNLDIFAYILKDIWKELGKITGTEEDEKIIDLIFSKFCLGK